MPEISVVMGAYNVGDKDLLEKAIESILKQTYKDFEFIICDDGSTDDTYKYLQEFASKDSRIVLIKSEKNNGLSHALNMGIEKAKGKYIARMDADDISALDRLEKEYNFLEQHNEYAIVATNVKLIDQDGKIIGKRLKPEIIKKEDFLFTSPITHPTVMMRKEALKSVNNYSEAKEALRTEDYDLWMRMFAKGYKIYTIQECLYYFREDDNCLKRRKYKYRLNEVVVRYKGFKALKLFPKGYLYVIKPLIVGIIPRGMLKNIRTKVKKENI